MIRGGSDEMDVRGLGWIFSVATRPLFSVPIWHETGTTKITQCSTWTHLVVDAGENLESSVQTATSRCASLTFAEERCMKRMQ